MGLGRGFGRGFVAAGHPLKHKKEIIRGTKGSIAKTPQSY